MIRKVFLLVFILTLWALNGYAKKWQVIVYTFTNKGSAEFASYREEIPQSIRIRLGQLKSDILEVESGSKTRVIMLQKAFTKLDYPLSASEKLRLLNASKGYDVAIIGSYRATKKTLRLRLEVLVVKTGKRILYFDETIKRLPELYDKLIDKVVSKIGAAIESELGKPKEEELKLPEKPQLATKCPPCTCNCPTLPKVPEYGSSGIWEIGGYIDGIITLQHLMLANMFQGEIFEDDPIVQRLNTDPLASAYNMLMDRFKLVIAKPYIGYFITHNFEIIVMPEAYINIARGNDNRYAFILMPGYVNKATDTLYLYGYIRLGVMFLNKYYYLAQFRYVSEDLRTYITLDRYAGDTFDTVIRVGNQFGLKWKIFDHVLMDLGIVIDFASSIISLNIFQAIPVFHYGISVYF